MCITRVICSNIVEIHVVSDLFHDRSTALHRTSMQRQLCSQVEILVTQLGNIHSLIPCELIVSQIKLVFKQLELLLLQHPIQNPGSLIATGIPPIQIQSILSQIQLVGSHTLSRSNLVSELLSRHLLPRSQPRRCVKPIRKTSSRVDTLCSQRCCLPSIQPRSRIKPVRQPSRRIDTNIELADLLIQPVLINPPIQPALTDSQSPIQRGLTNTSRQARNIHPGSQPRSNSTRIQT